MPPRFAYWTIIFGGQPTAFRSATRDELLPTFKQIQSKHPDAQLRYFARGKLWYSDEEAQAALIRERFERRERPRPTGPRPRPGQWKPREENRPPRQKDWQPHGQNRPVKPGGWKPRADFRKPEAGSWKPKTESRKPEAGSWRPKAGGWKPKPGSWKPKAESRKPEAGSWKPRPGDEHPGAPKPRSGEGGRGREWRPGGAHKDPRSRFKVPRDVKRRGMARKFGWKKKKDEE